MNNQNFVHLHVHTQYSLLDGACHLPKLIKQAHKNKMSALAITDHGNMFGTIEFYQESIRQGIKPIIGCEVYTAPGSRFEKKSLRGMETAYHLILLVKNKEGYKNLMKLVTVGYLEGFYYKPRIDKEILTKHSAGLIGLSGCLNGEIPSLLSKKLYEKAKKVALEYKEIFGKDNFYLELQDLGIERQKEINQGLIKLSKETSLPLVATNDIHYLLKEHAQAHDVLLCVQTGATIDEERRLKFPTSEFYFKTAAEMEVLFAEIPEALANTAEIADRCNLELDFGKLYLPYYEAPPVYENNLNKYLKDLCLEGLKKRCDELSSEIKERLNQELEIIFTMGYAGYFLIVWDFVRYAKEKGIPVGPGRGSIVGSLVAYVLGITDIDPLKYGLLFERFLNPGRIGLPDIDLDFADERRDEIINYVIKKYGRDKVSQIITFGTMAARGVIRDVGRALNIPYSEVDKIAKLIPFNASTLAEALETVQELKEIENKSEQNKSLIEISKILEGLARHASTHAAGIVISKDELINYVPFYKDAKNKIATQYAMNSLEAIGLLKMDFLGLRNLTVIEETLSSISREGKEIRPEGIPLDDKKTYNLLKGARTIGTFQLESPGFRDLLRKAEPQEFEDVIALMALHRPGALNSGMTDDYVACKRGMKKVEYPHPKLEPILKDTYGTILYQEQVMKIANELAGFSLEQADNLRKAMGKKIPEIMAQQREVFLKGAQKNGIEKKKAKEIFDLMAHFAGYGFNKSHSAGYAMISYRTAYLKANYPVEYMAALLSSESNNSDKIALYIRECQRMRIKVFPPDVNESFAKFTVTGKDIRFGLSAVKNVGAGAIASIIKGRKESNYTTLYDFCERVDLRLANKKTMESLIKCGAFDSLGLYRAQTLTILDEALSAAQQVQKDKSKGQISLFEGFKFKEEFQSFPEKIEEWSEGKLLNYEKEMLGLYITGHPLARFAKEIKKYANTSTSALSNFKNKEEVRVGGIIERIKTKTTRNGKRMAFLQFEDLEGNVEVLVWPETFEKFRFQIKPNLLVLIGGKVDINEEQIKIIAEEVTPLKEMREKLTKSVHIKISTAGLTEDLLSDLKQILLKHKGNCTAYLHLETVHHGEVITQIGFHSSDFKLEPTDKLITEVEKLIGEESIWFS